MKGGKHFFYLAIILGLAALLRFGDLATTPPGLWSDEAMNGVNTIQALGGGNWKIYYPENFGREGLFINIQAIFVKFLGHEPWVLRLPSAIFGVLTVLGLYFMTKELFGRRAGLFASFFLATSFWHIIFSRMGFRAIMAPFLLVWSFYFLLLAIRLASSPRSPTSRGSRTSSRARPDLLIALAGIMFGLGFHTYIAFRIAPLLALYPLWLFYKKYRDEKLKDGICAPCLIVLFIFMAIIAASPLLIYYGLHPADFLGRTSSISIFSAPEPLGQFSENVLKTVQMFNFFGDFNWRHNYAGSPQLWWPVGILFLIGIWKALRKIAGNKNSGLAHSGLLALNPLYGDSDAHTHSGTRSPSSEFLFPYAEAASKFILFWFFIMMLPVVMSSEGLPHALRSIVLIPPVMIFAASGLEIVIVKFQEWLAGWKKQFPEKLFQLSRIEQELKILLFIFLLSVAAQSFNQYFLRWAPNPNVYDSFLGDETKIAHWLNNEPSAIKKYVVTNSTDTADVTGRPLSFAPIIFITDTYFENKQKEKNIYYFGSAEFDKIDCSAPCTIIPVESRPTIYETLKEKIPNLRIDGSPGFVVLKN